MRRAVRAIIATAVASLPALWTASSAVANPYPDPARVPRVAPDFWQTALTEKQAQVLTRGILDGEAEWMLRVRVDYDADSGAFTLAHAVIEKSGTPAALARASHEDELGSYRGSLLDPVTGQALAYDSIGTGQEFRRLTRAISFRFPVPTAPVDFRFVGENPETGVMQEILTARLDPAAISRVEPSADVDVRELRPATMSPAIIVNVYAEGYTATERERFFRDAARVARVLSEEDFPGQEHMTVRGVFAASATRLGTARELGMPVPERDSFLGLYFPYWRNFGRWYHVVYPTREERFRTALAQAPYDYPVALVNDSEYWGVGNYRELTAIPARNQSFGYLLLHEFGHFFGLNEEYEGGGPTELAFAPGIAEPWSQNITFQTDGTQLKWGDLVRSTTPLPTPASYWRGDGPFGAYRGGYAQTQPFGLSHKPGMSCTMESGQSFCPICRRAVEQKLMFDLGL